MSAHRWVPSTLGHGDAMCSWCSMTNREAAAIGAMQRCDKAPVPTPTADSRLRADLAQLTERAAATSDEMQRLAAENEALRAALKRIATISRGPYRDQMDLAQVIARAALRAEIEGEPT